MQNCGMKINLNHNSTVPIYRQIEEQLRKIIRSEEYKNGKMLPNEVELSKQLGVSRSTLRQAINKLVYDGLLARKKGVGTMVADTPVVSKANNWLSFSQEMKALGIEIKNYELSIGWRKPTDEQCRFFNIDSDTKILKLERLRGTKEGAFVFFVSYFNPQLALTGEEDFSRPLYSIFQDYNVFVKTSKEEISAIASDHLLAEKLDLAVGDPILKRKRFVFDSNGNPAEWNVGYYRADSFVYTIECKKD